METELIPLQQLYLMALASAAQAEGFASVLQEQGKDAGRLWLMPENTTVPIASICFKFENDMVDLAAVHRDERQLCRRVRYSEGLDGFLEELRGFFHARRLAPPKPHDSAQGRTRPHKFSPTCQCSKCRAGISDPVDAVAIARPA